MIRVLFVFVLLVVPAYAQAPAPDCAGLLAPKGLLATLAMAREFFPAPPPPPSPVVAAPIAAPMPPMVVPMPAVPLSPGDSLRQEAAKVDRRDVLSQRLHDTFVTCQPKEKK
jgi:hypothetical protein